MRANVIPLVFTGLVGAASCGIGGSSLQHVKLAHLGFDLPGGWHNTDLNQRGVVTSVWIPEDNDPKESITVIRTERSPAVAQAGVDAIEGLLARAQMPGAQASAARAVTTAHGLGGARIDSDYVPPGMTSSYHRVHVVVTNGPSLIHVIYTAAAPEASLGTFNTVLSSLHEES